MLIIDTVAAAVKGESVNDDNVVGKLFALSQALVREFECTVVFVAHPGKDKSKGIAGTYRFQGNSDFILRTGKMKVGFRLVKEKDRNGLPERGLFNFTLNFVEVERTTSGKPRTGAIVGMMTACLQESHSQHVDPKEQLAALAFDAHFARTALDRSLLAEHEIDGEPHLSFADKSQSAAAG